MQFNGLKRIVLGKVGYAAMTDGEGAVGTYDFTVKIPKGLLPVQAALVAKEGFIGDVSASASLGTTADPDAYVTAGSVFADADIVTNVPSDPDVGIAAAQTVKLTMTVDADWGDVTAGELTAIVWCVDLNVQVVADT